VPPSRTARSTQEPIRLPFSAGAMNCCISRRANDNDLTTSDNAGGTKPDNTADCLFFGVRP
jgi:hypothetical protein